MSKASEKPLEKTGPSIPNGTNPGKSEPPPDNGWRATPHWYAAEIIVVVVGVIIALAANAWWEGWREESLETEVIRAVRQELEENRESLVAVLGATDDCLSRADRFLRMSPRSLKMIPADSGFYWVSGLSCRRTYDPSVSAAEALGGAPGLDSVDDLRIRTAVARWVTALTDAAEEKAELSRRGDAVYQVLVPYAEVYATAGLADFPSIPRIVARGAPAVLSDLRQDVEVVEAVIHKAHYQQAYRQELGKALTAADSALALLAPSGRR